jgi:hypothetical protein
MKLAFLNRRTLAAGCALALVIACSDDDANEATFTAQPAGAAGAASGGRAGSNVGGSAGTGGAVGRAGATARGGAPGLGGSAGTPSAAGGAAAGGAPASAAGAGGAAGGAAGAVNAGGSAGQGGPDAGAVEVELVTYTADIRPILVANCGTCHTAPNNRGGHNATSSYDDAVRVADDIVGEISSGGMPLNTGCNGGEPGAPGCVSVDDFELIQQWVEDGTPE